MEPVTQIDLCSAFYAAYSGSTCLKKWFLPNVLDFNWLAFYSTKVFKDDKWAIHYYAPIQGHELVTRRDLIPSEPDHPRSGQWYFKVQVCC